MQTQQRPFVGQQKLRKRKKGRDSEQESGLLNMSEQLQTYIRDQDESCVEKVKSSFWPLLLTLTLTLILGVIVYRYFWMIDHPKAAIQQNIPLTPSLHKDVPYEQQQSPAQHLNQSPVKQKNSLDQNRQSKIQQISIKQTQKDDFPLKLWFFDKKQGMNNNEKFLSFYDYSKNWQYYSKLSNLTVQTVSIQNFQNFINDQQTIGIIKKINSFSIQPSLKEKIIKTIIMLSVLENNGGVIIGGDMIFTQPLDSQIKKVQQNPNLTLFSFNSHPNDELFRIDLQNYFIMARKSCPYINQFLQKILVVLSNKIKQEQASPDTTQKWTQNFDQKFENAFSLSFKNNQPQKSKIYSLGNQNTIKIQNNPFLNLTLQSHFKYFYSLQQKALEQMIGPIKPIVQFPSKSYQQFIINSQNEQRSQILKNSFIYQHLLSLSKKYQNIKPIQLKKSTTQSQSSWQLPNIIWTFFTKNHLSDPLHQLFLQNVYQKSKLSGFQFIILTESNINTVFSEPQMKQIKLILTKMNENQNQNAMNSIKEDQILTSLIKIKVLSKYGGVFIDHGYFLLDDLKWLTNIQSNNHIFNKKQHQNPQTFMFHKNENFKWWININSGEKQADQLIYLTNFIAANRDSHLIKDWLSQVEKSMAMSKNDLSDKLQSQCQIKDWKIQNIFQITLKCMLMNSRKINPTQTQVKTTQKNIFNVWSMNSLLAGQKTDLITKEDESLCYSFDSSYKEFMQIHGTMGYISPIETKRSRKQIQLYLKKQHRGSIFNKFFTQPNQKQKDETSLWNHAKKDYIKDVIDKVQKVNNK